jgi:putative two-component system response regulator
LSILTIESSPEIAAPRYTVLVVDDDPTARLFFRRLLDDAGYVVKEAVDGAAALQAISALSPDVVLLDIELPEIDGFEVCRRVRQNAATRLTPVIIVTGFQALEQRIEGLEAGADDFLTKPVDQRELLARVRSLARIKSYTDDLDSAAAIIMTVATMIEARDGYSQGHCSRMANYALRLGRMLQFGDDDLQALHRGGFLHDIGMLAIPDSVLRKQGSLEPDEYELIRSHTVVGDKLCGNLRSLQRVRPIIRSHHERLDGSGYPDGLHGDQIPLIAQVIGVVDVYEALTAQRPYQDAHSSSEAIQVLRKQVACGWRERDIVEAFVEVARSV